MSNFLHLRIDMSFMRKRYHLLSLLLLFAHVAALYGQKKHSFSIQPNAAYVPGHLILKIHDPYRADCQAQSIDIPEIQALFTEIGVSKVEKIYPHHAPPVQTRNTSGLSLADISLIYAINYSGQSAVEDVINRLLLHPAIAYAEPRYVYHTFYQPNDPYADSSGGRFGFQGQWFLTQIQAREAWDIQRGDSSIVVGIVDSGGELGHPDMLENHYINTDDPIDGIDNDNDGYTDNYWGWDHAGASFATPGDNMPFIQGGNLHGFAVSGIVGATTDNGIGVAGTSFNCRYIPIKAAPDDSLNFILFGYEGVVYAVDQGAQIVNWFLGRPRQQSVRRRHY